MRDILSLWGIWIILLLIIVRISSVICVSKKCFNYYKISKFRNTYYNSIPDD